MQADFLDAYVRHWDDAERLFQAERWANADHLYGMAAECGLKRLMLAFGMPFDSANDRPVKNKDRTHADGIWARFESYRCGHHQGAAYALSPTNPFGDWHVSQRYAHQGHFDQPLAQAHRSGADLVRALLKKAQKEGLI
ncbi:MAG: SAM-dependent methyltransferase [Pseudomonadota bacterium]